MNIPTDLLITLGMLIIFSIIGIIGFILIYNYIRPLKVTLYRKSGYGFEQLKSKRLGLNAKTFKYKKQEYQVTLIEHEIVNKDDIKNGKVIKPESMKPICKRKGRRIFLDYDINKPFPIGLVDYDYPNTANIKTIVDSDLIKNMFGKNTHTIIAFILLAIVAVGAFGGLVYENNQQSGLQTQLLNTQTTLGNLNSTYVYFITLWESGKLPDYNSTYGQTGGTHGIG